MQTAVNSFIISAAYHDKPQFTSKSQSNGDECGSLALGILQVLQSTLQQMSSHSPQSFALMSSHPPQSFEQTIGFPLTSSGKIKKREWKNMWESSFNTQKHCVYIFGCFIGQKSVPWFLLKGGRTGRCSLTVTPKVKKGTQYDNY